jgi:hypothetical protein
MFTIHSTYQPYAPESDTYPTGREWTPPAADYAAAWEAVKAYLCQQQQWQELTSSTSGRVGLAPAGHTEPFAFFGDTLFINDAEVIDIRAQKMVLPGQLDPALAAKVEAGEISSSCVCSLPLELCNFQCPEGVQAIADFNNE